jgi:hypothetical protein
MPGSNGAAKAAPFQNKDRNQFSKQEFETNLQNKNPKSICKNNLVAQHTGEGASPVSTEVKRR